MINISVSGFNSLNKTLKRFDKVDIKLLDLALKLCRVGEPVIRSTHGNHATINIVPIKNGYALNAEGEDILFIEFGTGDMTGSTKALYDQVPVTIYPGSWSEAHNGEYYQTGGYLKGFWHFAGQEYHYTEPHPAFYYAYQAMIIALPRIASGVFS